MRFIVFLLSLCALISCGSSDEIVGTCIAFDTRQCMGDPWAEVVDRNASAETQAQELKAFLSEEGIDALEVRADLNFHSIVCEACFVCPENPRYFLTVKDADIPQLQALELLNFSMLDCE